MKKISKNATAVLSSTALGILMVCILASALFAIDSSVKGKPFTLTLCLFLTFLFLFFYHIVYAFNQRNEDKKNKIGFFKCLGFGVVYLAVAILCFVLPYGFLLIELMSSLYLATIIANRVCLMIEKRKLASFIGNGILLIICAFLFVIIVFGCTPEDTFAVMIALLFALVIISLIDVLSFAFSKIQLKGLLRIMRDTYVFEIIFGLLILIVASSFYFAIMEDSIESFGDGLWYSFAIITTIGLGDLTVKSLTSRILSVILGIYGIIVVATITSVIVNYYNEVKDERNRKKEEEKKLLEEQALEETKKEEQNSNK